MPPPTSRKSTLAVSHALAPPPFRSGPKDVFQVVLPAWVEHGEDLVAGLEHGVGAGDEALAGAQDGDQQAAFGHLQVADPPPGHPESWPSSISMISSCSSCRSSRWTSPYSGTSCSSRRRIRSVAETDGLISSRSKCWRLRGLLTRAMTLVDQVLLAGDLADQHVVLVVAGDRDHHVGALDPGPLQHPELGGVAVGDVVLKLLLDGQVAAAVALDHRHLVVLLEQLASQVPADLARSDDDDVHGLLPSRR